MTVLLPTQNNVYHLNTKPEDMFYAYAKCRILFYIFEKVLNFWIEIDILRVHGHSISWLL